MLDSQDEVRLSDAELLALSIEVVSAHVSNNKVAAEKLPDLIESVHGRLRRMMAAEVRVAAPATAVEPVGDQADEAETAVETEVEAPRPAVPVAESMTGEHIFCLDCGRKMRTLRRHLAV